MTEAEIAKAHATYKRDAEYERDRQDRHTKWLKPTSNDAARLAMLEWGEAFYGGWLIAIRGAASARAAASLAAQSAAAQP